MKSSLVCRFAVLRAPSGLHVERRIQRDVPCRSIETVTFGASRIVQHRISRSRPGPQSFHPRRTRCVLWRFRYKPIISAPSPRTEDRCSPCNGRAVRLSFVLANRCTVDRSARSHPHFAAGPLRTSVDWLLASSAAASLHRWCCFTWLASLVPRFQPRIRLARNAPSSADRRRTCSDPLQSGCS